MKIIFSRKGFDSSAGGVPSPILPGGTLCYLPIPEEGSCRKYSDVTCEGRNLGDVVEALPRCDIKRGDGVHLDPDIDPNALPSRMPGWKGLFGQAGAPQTHLARRVKEGDLFLFFGWYKRAEISGGQIGYIRGAPDLHVLFGWMQIGRIRKIDDVRQNDNDLPWAKYHPHFRWSGDPLNTLYVATEKLELPGLKESIPGAGVFRALEDRLVLTAPAPNSARSQWRLPEWFYPVSPKKPLSFHSNLSRWCRSTNCAYLDTVRRGQEFVLDCDHYPQALGWLEELFEHAACRQLPHSTIDG